MTGLSTLLEPTVVARGVMVQVAIAAPPAVLVRNLRHDDLGATSSLWLVAAFLALVVGPAAAGWTVARRQPESPITHAVAVTLLAWAAMGAVSVLRSAVADEAILPLVTSLASIAPVQVGIGVLAATFARPPTEPEETHP